MFTRCFERTTESALSLSVLRGPGGPRRGQPQSHPDWPGPGKPDPVPRGLGVRRGG